jgi:hypothetical protein
MSVADAPAEIPFCDGTTTLKTLVAMHDYCPTVVYDYLQTGNLNKVMDQFLGESIAEGYIKG